MTETNVSDGKPESVETSAQPEQENGASAGEKAAVRSHGKSFIYMALEDADKCLRLIDQHEKKMSIEGFARALGHPEPKGRFRQKLDALEEYRLVQVIGGHVVLTESAVEMLYGGSEAARARARAQAFLSCDMFKRTFVEAPKNQNYELSYLREFVKAKLHIVNASELYVRRFLESAAFAGLLDGDPSPKAATIRLRPAALAAQGTGEAAAASAAKSPDEQWLLVAPDEAMSTLSALGLAQYEARSQVSQRSAGDVAITMADGRISVEVRRPVQVSIKSDDMLADVTAIIKSLRQKGFKA